jgi:hypothetical protein
VNLRSRISLAGRLKGQIQPNLVPVLEAACHGLGGLATVTGTPSMLLIAELRHTFGRNHPTRCWTMLRQFDPMTTSGDHYCWASPYEGKKMDLEILKDTPPWDWPEDAGKMFLGILRDDQAGASERLLAADLAGAFTVINDELAAALLAIALNGAESEGLRSEALGSLGPVLEYADMEGFEVADETPISEETFGTIQESLRGLYLDAGVPEGVRRQAFEASVRAPQDWHADAIRSAYSSGDESWMLTAVFAMRFVPGFNDQILEALENTNQDIHYQAVCAAGDWEVEAAWSHIAGLATTEGTDKPLRLAAIDAVAVIRPQEAVAILTELTESDDEDIVEAAHEALAMAEGYSNEDEDDDELLI